MIQYGNHIIVSRVHNSRTEPSVGYPIKKIKNKKSKLTYMTFQTGCHMEQPLSCTKHMAYSWPAVRTHMLCHSKRYPNKPHVRRRNKLQKPTAVIMQGEMVMTHLSTCISPSPVVNLSSGKLPIGEHVFSRALRTAYGLTGMPSACTSDHRYQNHEPDEKPKNRTWSQKMQNRDG